MAYWHEKVEKYPGDGALATILMMYLSLGPDWPYHIAETFQSAKDKNELFALKIYETKGCRRLFNHSALSSIMVRMRRDGLLVSKVDETKPRNPTVYSLNPGVLRAPTDTIPYKMNSGDSFEIPLEQIEDLLKFLRTMNKDDRIDRLKDPVILRDLDYIYFLVFVKYQAMKMDDEYVSSCGEVYDQKLSEFLGKYEKELYRVSNTTSETLVIRYYIQSFSE